MIHAEFLGNTMTDDATKLTSQGPSAGDENAVKIQSKYGPLEIQLSKAVHFPQGLLGMPANKDYGLTHFPNNSMPQFKLLQNLNDHELCFAVLPIATEADIFDPKDILEACAATQIARDNLLILSIISVQRTPEEVRVTANVRAPLLIDSVGRVGIQYVFPSNRYEIRHLLSQTQIKKG